MKILPLLVLAALSLTAFAETPTLLNKPGEVISAPDLKSPLGKEWSTSKGKWEPAEGVLTASEIPEEKHSAVLHLATGPTPLVWECDFRLHGSKIFYVGCDGARHVGRVTIVPKKVMVQEDSTEVKGKSPSHTLAESPLDLKADEWQHLRVEYRDDQIVAQLNGLTLKAQHPYLATPKVRWWFAAGGNGAQVKNVRITKGEPLAP